MATFVPAKKNTAFIMYISLPDQSDQRLMKSSPTIAAGDFKVSIDGGALANLATLPTVTPAAGKMVKVSMSAAEMNGDNITLVCSDAAGAEWCDLTIPIPTAARQIDDLAYPATSGRSMVVDAAGLVDANTVKVGPTGAGTAQTAGDVIGDTNDIQTRLPAALVTGRMDSSVGAMAAGTVTAAAIATDAIDADAIAASAVTEIQSGLATSAALATVQADTDNIQTRLPAALIGGSMNSSVELWQGSPIVGTNIPGVPAVDPIAWAGGTIPAQAIPGIPEVDISTAETAILTAIGTIDDDVWAKVLDAGFTATEIVRLIASACAGKLSGAATPVNIMRSLADTKNRITANVDASGNRTGVAYDATP